MNFETLQLALAQKPKLTLHLTSSSVLPRLLLSFLLTLI